MGGRWGLLRDLGRHLLTDASLRGDMVARLVEWGSADGDRVAIVESRAAVSTSAVAEVRTGYAERSPVTARM